MKRRVHIGWVCLAAVVMSAAACLAAPQKWVKLEGATLGDGYMDGDSFHVRHQGKDYIIRLYFVDVPENNDQFLDRNQEQADYFGISLKRIVPLGEKGKKFAYRQLAGKKFTVYTKWKDAMGSSSQKRFFGLVRIGKQDLGELLVEYGLARIYGASEILPDGTSIDSSFQRLRHLERRAKAKKYGAWSKRDSDADDAGWFSAEDQEAIFEAIDEIEPYEFGEGGWVNVPTVAFLRAESFMNKEQFEDAEIEMRRLLRRFPNHNQKARIEFYRALSVAMQERFVEAVELFRQWLVDWPDHILVPDVQYWLPISMYYDGLYEEALPLFDAYASKYPMSIYAPEASYRAACCRYALEEYERVANDIEKWLETYPEHFFIHEATIMRGDSLAALGELEDALVAYRKAFTPDAKAFYYMALTQATRIYKALNEEPRFHDMARMYLDYIKNNPNDPNIVDAAWQAGWAYKQVKRNDLARTLYWQMIERYGNTPAWEGFELMLTDLATMYTRGSAEYEVDLKAWYNKALNGQRMTMASRLSMAEIMLLPEAQRPGQLKNFLIRFKTEDMGPETLAWIGEMWIDQGMSASGMPYLELLVTKYSDSRYLPKAYALLAEQAVEKKDFSSALTYVNFVLESVAEVDVMLDATFLKAEALRGLGQNGEAIENYKTILSSRGVPRLYKPLSLLGIGQCFEAQKEFAQAVAYYQRLYVMYGAFQNEVIQAYLRSGYCFEQLGDKTAAINTYNDLLALDYIHGRAEAAEARARLARLGGGAS